MGITCNGGEGGSCGPCTGLSAGANCTLDCLSNRQCDKNTLTCTNAHGCVVNCDSFDACYQGILNGEQATSLTVICGDTSSSGNDGACWSLTINAQNVPDVYVECSDNGNDDAWNCNSAVIHCGTGLCHIKCVGESCFNLIVDATLSSQYICVDDNNNGCADIALTTSNPTPQPTDQPTINPTAQPTSIPTATTNPTRQPTPQPTINPTPQPTYIPTYTTNPTNQPTSQPTNQPTPQPANNPTTSIPSTNPTTYSPTTSNPTTSKPTINTTLQPTTSEPSTNAPITSNPTPVTTPTDTQPTINPTPQTTTSVTTQIPTVSPLTEIIVEDTTNIPILSTQKHKISSVNGPSLTVILVVVVVSFIVAILIGFIIYRICINKRINNATERQTKTNQQLHSDNDTNNQLKDEDNEIVGIVDLKRDQNDINDHYVTQIGGDDDKQEENELFVKGNLNTPQYPVNDYNKNKICTAKGNYSDSDDSFTDEQTENKDKQQNATTRFEGETINDNSFKKIENEPILDNPNIIQTPNPDAS